MSEDRRIVGASLRASDDDRERFAAELRAHTVAGRLTTDELEERLARGYEARTLGELDALRVDLPQTAEAIALSDRERRGRLTRRTVQETGGSLGAFAVCTAIWVASGATGFFWPLLVAIGVIGLLARNVWDLYGPAADLDAAEARLDAHRDRHSDAHGRRRGRSEDDDMGRPVRRDRHRHR